MSNKYKILSTGNTIIADQFFIEGHHSGDYEQLPDEAGAPISVPRQITVGAFFDRFGGQKWPILASTEPMVQALIKDCQVRKFVDLGRSDLPAGLEMIVNAGFAIDPHEVINAPVRSDEVPM